MNENTELSLCMLVEADSLANSLAFELSDDELLDLLVKVDMLVGSSDFTKRVASKFKKLVKANEKEAAEAEALATVPREEIPVTLHSLGSEIVTSGGYTSGCGCQS